MKKSKKRNLSALIIEPKLTEITNDELSEQGKRFWSNWSGGERIAAVAVCLLLVVSALGGTLKYLEESAREQKLQARNSPLNQPSSLLNSVNPFVEPPLPTSTPQLSKEYIYAGSRMLAVEDANASASPPSDLAVWRPSTGYWYVMGGQGSQATSVQWGQSGDETVPGDYDGDGKTDFSVFRASANAWYIQRSSDSAFLAYSFGQSGDEPAAADYDGDGKTDAAVVRSNYQNSGHLIFLIQFSSTGTFNGYIYGNDSDVPKPADFDGDGKADLAVWRSSDATFYYAKSSANYNGFGSVACGSSGDTPIPADYDGDGKADAAVRSGTDWKIRESSTNTIVTVPWYAGDKEVQNDYDGDGKVDIATWTASGGVWKIRQSSNLSTRTENWGQTGDIPVPAFYRR